MKMRTPGIVLIALGAIVSSPTLGIGGETKALNSSAPCHRCVGQLLAGSTLPHPKTKWGIISDLPESFSGYGVLYATTDLLPDNGSPEAMRRQTKKNGFQTIDGSFDVFLFHLLKETTATARLVVYVKNNGKTPVSIKPRQVIKSEGVIGATHDFESELGRRVLAEEWDKAPLAMDGVTIPPGTGRVIARGKQFGNVQSEGPGASRNLNCFGYVRAIVDSAGQPDLDVYVIAIPATEHAAILAETERLLFTGATSTDSVPMDSAPSGCAVRRSVGVYPNFIWQNSPTTILASTVAKAHATTFPMALPEIQTAGCADARQTTDLALHPQYTRPDTIGNYMIEYRVVVTLTNDTELPTKMDALFGKQEADVGLAYDVHVLPGTVTPNNVNFNAMRQIKTAWAGPKQSAMEKPFIADGVTMAVGESKTVALRFLICGNSSLPFSLGFQRRD